MAKETEHIISRSNKIVSMFLYDDILAALITKKRKKNRTIPVEHIISESEKNTCYSSPSYGMAKETGHLISEPNRLTSNFLYDDKLVPLLRDGQRKKGKKRATPEPIRRYRKGEQRQ